MENKIFEKALENVAMWSATATIRYIADTSADEKSISLKYGLQNGKHTLKQCEYLAEQIAEIEKAIQRNKDEIKLNEKTISICKKEQKKCDLFTDSGLNKFMEYEHEIFTLKDDNSRLRTVNAEYGKKLISLYDGLLNKAVADGYELKQIAFLAIWEYVGIIKSKFEKCNVNWNIDLDDYNNEDTQEFIKTLGNIEILTVTPKVVETHNLKRIKKIYQIVGTSKNGALTKIKVLERLTVKKIGDKAVREYLNKNRSGIGAKTDFLIVGYDTEGNELTIQSNKLLTYGGIDTIEGKITAEKMFGQFESVLTLRQIEIVKLLVMGYNQTQIAEKLGVKQNTISDHIKAIRKTLTAVGFSYDEKAI